MMPSQTVRLFEGMQIGFMNCVMCNIQNTAHHIVKASVHVDVSVFLFFCFVFSFKVNTAQHTKLFCSLPQKQPLWAYGGFRLIGN